jgi:hypothetical protein
MRGSAIALSMEKSSIEFGCKVCSHTSIPFTYRNVWEKIL